MANLVMVSQRCIKIYAAIIAVKGIPSVAVECILVVKPSDVLWLGASAWEDSKGEGLILCPSEVLMTLLQQFHGYGGQRRQNEYDPFVRDCHITEYSVSDVLALSPGDCLNGSRTR